MRAIFGTPMATSSTPSSWGESARPVPAFGMEEGAGLIRLRFNPPLPKRVSNGNWKCDDNIYGGKDKAPHHNSEKIHAPRVTMYVGVIIVGDRRRRDHDVASQTEENQRNQAEAEKPPSRRERRPKCYAQQQAKQNDQHRWDCNQRNHSGSISRTYSASHRSPHCSLPVIPLPGLDPGASNVGANGCRIKSGMTSSGR